MFIYWCKSTTFNFTPNANVYYWNKFALGIIQFEIRNIMLSYIVIYLQLSFLIYKLFLQHWFLIDSISSLRTTAKNTQQEYDSDYKYAAELLPNLEIFFFFFLNHVFKTD